jgi:O-antigen ligase
VLVRHVAFDRDGQLMCARTLVNVAAYVTALGLLLRSGRINWLLAGLLIGALVSVGLAFADISLPGMVTTSVRMGNGRWQGLMPGANRFANLCAIAFVTSVGLLGRNKLGSCRGRLVIATMAALLGLVMSGSRGATLTTCVATVFLFWLSGLAKGRLFLSPRIVAASLLAVTMGVGLFCFYWESIPERLVALIESPNDALAAIEDDARRDLFETAWEVFLERPAFGGGADAADLTVATRQGLMEISSHSMYLELLTGSGFFGLITYFALPVFILFRLGSSYVARTRPPIRDDTLAPLAMTWLLLIFFHGVVISIGQATHVWLLFAAAAYVCITETGGSRGSPFRRRPPWPVARSRGWTRRPRRMPQWRVG